LYLTWLGDARLYELFARIDDELAESVRRDGCSACGEVLHSARFPRKPRGSPVGVALGDVRRRSFCCAADGCRKRATPPSVRYLGRKVYLGAVIVLACALRDGLTPARVARLRSQLGVDRRTLARWRAWWRTSFPATSWWRGARGRFAPPLLAASLPGALLERFGGDGFAPLVALLRFVSPITTSTRT
jgi:hypothetical protein